MVYIFNCQVCNKDWDIDIPMDKYNDLKNKQHCPWCKGIITRKTEWGEIPSGSWVVRSDGCGPL